MPSLNEMGGSVMRCEFGQGVREWAQDFWNEILFPFFVTAGLLLPLILVVGVFLVWDEQRQAEWGALLPDGMSVGGKKQKCGLLVRSGKYSAMRNDPGACECGRV